MVARQLAEALVHVARPQRFDAAAEQAGTLAARGGGGGGGGGGKRTGRAGSHGWNSGGHVRTPRASEGERAEAPSMPILRVSVRLLACASCAGWGGWLAPHCGRLGWMVEVD